MRLLRLVPALVIASRVTAQAPSLPAWAYPLMDPPPAAPPSAVDSAVRHVPGSAAAFMTLQTRDRFAVPDWHPASHPAMPPSVSSGRRPDVAACGYCHLPNGQGRPENASLAGLSAKYIARQVADFRDGKRRSAEPRMIPPANMAILASHTNDAEVREAAAYFAKLKPRPWIRVVETDSVPATKVAGYMLVVAPNAPKEAIAGRIIETPEDLERTELRDALSGFVAFAPTGSLARGEQLVKKGANGSQACSRCHGGELRGSGDIPRLAGRSPSYLVRQLYDFKTGARNGEQGKPMKDVVAKLTPDDIVAIAAYLASRNP